MRLSPALVDVLAACVHHLGKLVTVVVGSGTHSPRSGRLGRLRSVASCGMLEDWIHLDKSPSPLSFTLALIGFAKLYRLPSFYHEDLQLVPANADRSPRGRHVEPEIFRQYIDMKLIECFC